MMVITSWSWKAWVGTSLGIQIGAFIFRHSKYYNKYTIDSQMTYEKELEKQKEKELF